MYESFSLQVIDGAAGGTLARVLSYGGMGTINSNSGLSGTTSKRSSLTRTVTPNHLGLSSLTLSGSVQAEKDKDNSSSGQAENLAQDMHDLMHDFDVVSRISGLIGSLKGQYEVIFPFFRPFFVSYLVFVSSYSSQNNLDVELIFLSLSLRYFCCQN